MLSVFNLLPSTPLPEHAEVLEGANMAASASLDGAALDGMNEFAQLLDVKPAQTARSAQPFQGFQPLDAPADGVDYLNAESPPESQPNTNPVARSEAPADELVTKATNEIQRADKGAELASASLTARDIPNARPLDPLQRPAKSDVVSPVAMTSNKTSHAKLTSATLPPAPQEIHFVATTQIVGGTPSANFDAISSGGSGPGGPDSRAQPILRAPDAGVPKASPVHGIETSVTEPSTPPPNEPRTVNSPGLADARDHATTDLRNSEPQIDRATHKAQSLVSGQETTAKLSEKTALGPEKTQPSPPLAGADTAMPKAHFTADPAKARTQAFADDSAQNMVGRDWDDSADASRPTSTPKSALPPSTPLWLPSQLSQSVAIPSVSLLQLETMPLFESAPLPSFGTQSLPSGSPMQALGMTSGPVAPPLHTTVQVQIIDAMQAAASNEIEIRLEPEELGRLRIVMTPREGGMHVLVMAERSETLDLMRRHSDEFGGFLSEGGYENANFEFEAYQNANEEEDTDASGPKYLALPEPNIQRRSAISDGALDIRL